MKEQEHLTHTEASALLTGYVANELRGPARARIEQHIQGCQDCQHEITELQRIRTLLAYLRDEPTCYPDEEAFSLADLVYARLNDPTELQPFDLALTQPYPVELAAQSDRVTSDFDELPTVASMAGESSFPVLEGASNHLYEPESDLTQSGLDSDEQITITNTFMLVQSQQIPSYDTSRIPFLLSRRIQRHFQIISVLAATLVLVLIAGSFFYLYTQATSQQKHPTPISTRTVNTPVPVRTGTPKGNTLPQQTPVLSPTPTRQSIGDANAAAAITIVPASQMVQGTFSIGLTSGTPGGGQLQTRQVTAQQALASLTVNATGQGVAPATSATGQVTIQNTGDALQLPQGFTMDTGDYPGGQSVTVVLDQSVNLPAAIQGQPAPNATVPAHVQQTGAIGNELSTSIEFYHTASEELPTSWNALISTPFTGGSDAQSYTFVQTSDISNATQQVLDDAPPEVPFLQSQLKSGYRLVDGSGCPGYSASSDHIPNDHATTVTVTVIRFCSGAEYDYNGVLNAATQKLIDQATQQLEPDYGQSGNINTIIQASGYKYESEGYPETGFYVNAGAEGVWAYKFSTSQIQQIAQSIAGKTIAQAQSILTSLKGITKASITIDGGGNTLPEDTSKIQIAVEPTLT